MLLWLKRIRFYFAFIIIYLFFQMVFLYCLKSFSPDTNSDGFKIMENYKTIAAELNLNAKLDKSKSYKILNLKTSNYSAAYFDITLVTQCSSNHLSSIKKLSESWKGPVSVAVFSEAEYIKKTLWDLAKFQYCYNLKNLKLHLVVPNKERYNVYFHDHRKFDVNDPVLCNSSLLFTSIKKKNYNWTSAYPVNLLRNVAKRSSSTEFIFVVDIDMIPSPNLRLDFLNFVRPRRKKIGKEVFVVPIFEIQTGISLPKDKKELTKKIKLKQVRPFYAVPCKNCQRFTKYGVWLTFEERPGTRVLYQIIWRHPWEPFFIAKKNIPDFDERFKKYGMNRVSQICELYVAGYKFYVLDNHFLIHKGFKTLEDFHESKSKEMEENRNLYSVFKNELKQKYPYSERSC